MLYVDHENLTDCTAPELTCGFLKMCCQPAKGGGGKTNDSSSFGMQGDVE